MKEADHISRNL